MDFLQFFTNIDSVIYMFKFLNFEEQLKLSHVSRQLRDTIVNEVWNVKFRKVEITMMEMLFVVSDTLNEFSDISNPKHGIWRENSFMLTSKKLNIFLNINSNNIEKLQLYKFDAERDSYKIVVNALPFRIKFPNLTKLICSYIDVAEIDLQQVAVNCEKLETLKIYYCGNLKGELLENGLGIDIEILKDMQNLNNLSICTEEHTFSFFKNILNQLKLQQLTLEGIIVNDSENIYDDLNISNLKYYKELRINKFWKKSNFLYFQRNLLPNMENLCNLSLSSQGSFYIKKEFFNVLFESCKSLTHLHLWGFTINDFIALPSLNELKLKRCDGLTYSHLETILSEMELTYFKSVQINYTGDFKYFTISKSLQKIELYLYDINLIRLLEFNKANLTKLTELTYNEKEKYSVSNFAKNLKVLNIDYGELFAEDCLKLQHLQKLKLGGTIAISDFLLLLKHENLQKLSIGRISYSSDHKSVALKEMKNLYTNLRYLYLEEYNKEFISDILLDILNRNTKLSLVCGVYKVESIIDILIDEKFPKRFKNIKIHGVSIDCNSIRNKCEDTVNQMEKFIEPDEVGCIYVLLK